MNSELTYEEIEEHPYPFIAGCFLGLMFLVALFVSYGWVLLVLSIILHILVCVREEKRIKHGSHYGEKI